jgi:protein-S-isoprenylcysteine O-methyltransferase Ste14
MASIAVPDRGLRLRWLLATGLIAAFWSALFAVHLTAWLDHHRPDGVGVVLLELVFAVLFVIRRQPLTVNRHPLAWMVAGVGAFGMLAVRPHYAPIGGAWPATALQLLGCLGAICCLLTLGRSFGIVAAHRGLRTSGPYRLVRHPTYACYLVVAVGYLLENPTSRNLLVAGTVTAAQILRILEEERCLAADPAYRRYAGQVRSRLVPFVF